MKKSTIAFLLGFLTMTSLSAFADDDEMIVVGEQKVEIELSEETTIIDPTAVTVTHYDENGEPAAYLVEKDDGNKVIIGVDNKHLPILGGIINAYVGAQTLFGVKAGVSLFNTVDLGVHARANGTGSAQGAFYPFVTKTGAHANIKFRPFKKEFQDFKTVEFFAGIRWNNYKRVETGYGYERTSWKGNTTEFVGGMNFYIDERQSIGFEAGVANGTLDKYRYGELIEANIKHRAPVLSLTYTVRLFKI